MRINWEVQPSGNGWVGWVDLPIGPTADGTIRIARRAQSPGEAISEAVEDAHAMAGLLEHVGFIDLGSIIPGILDTASSVARMVTGRARRGEPMTTPETAKLPGPMARLAYVAAMRPGHPGPGMPWAPPGGPYGAPYSPGAGAPYGASAPYMPHSPWPR